MESHALLEQETNIRTKLVPSPSRLIKELERMVGHNYVIHMRHNIYRIRASKEIDLPSLIAAIRP